MPLPPYIAGRRGVETADRADYQTIYAAHDGAVAAPTAGLHFTPELMAALDARGISRHFVTLHVGAGTFLPVKADDTADHKMHFESGEISAETAAALNAVRARAAVASSPSARRRCACWRPPLARASSNPSAVPPTSSSRRAIAFRAVDILMTNFHLPRSTLFMLVAAFAGLERMQAAYAHAIACRLPLLLLRRRLPAVSPVDLQPHPGPHCGPVPGEGGATPSKVTGPTPTVPSRGRKLETATASDAGTRADIWIQAAGAGRRGAPRRR